MTTRIQISNQLRTKRRVMAQGSIGDSEVAVKMTDYVAVETTRTELERHGLCDDAWALIDSESGWPMHKKLAVLKYFWRVTSTLEWSALNSFDTQVIRDLTTGAGDGYDRHMAKDKKPRRGRDGGTPGGPVTLSSLGKYTEGG